VAALGFAAWVGATVGLIFRGMSPEGRFQRQALQWMGGIVLGYVVWILGMMRA
jgi:hypothetical protein